MSYKITVITVCYNCESEIEKTLLSVLNLNYDNLEYIIIDGSSKDNTLSIINKYKEKISVVLSEPDRGIFDAMNKGIKLATGDWIIFMNSGDTFVDSDCLNACFSKNFNDNVGVVFGKALTVYGLWNNRPFYLRPNSLVGMGICHQSIFVRADLAKGHYFDSKFKVSADYNMMRTIYELGYSFEAVDYPICNYDLNGFSANNSLRQLEEERLICHKSIFNLTYLYRRFKLLVKRILK